jgi:trans-2-enoyl-CoA reductase
MYAEYGDPIKVLSKKEVQLKDPKSNEVVVQMLAAPINPADINTIQGVYGVKPQLPAVGGNEGVGNIIKVGGNVKDLAPGDKVIPLGGATGSWRTHAIWSREDVLKIPKSTPVVAAATITVNPCTAYRMLKDFVDLRPGDTVIQNGSNSAVGQAVIQLARIWGLRTVNVIRSRPNLSEVVDYLKGLGATHVLTEEELRSKSTMEELFSTIPKPTLALNCVGGKSATELMRMLDYKGVHVTYGGMSMQPVTVPTGQLIFKDIRIRGYWMSHWHKEQGDSEPKQRMFDELCRMAEKGQFKPPPVNQVPIERFEEAIRQATEHSTGKKQLLIMDGPVS